MQRWLLVIAAVGCANHRDLSRDQVTPIDSIAWTKPTDIAKGGGEKGPWQQNESRFDYVDDPSVVLAADGAAHVVWVDQQRKDVLLQVFERDGRTRFSQPIDVSRSPATFSWLPRIALSPTDPEQVYILWQEIIFSGGSHGGDIVFARSRDGGKSFDEPQNLSRSIHGDGKGRITAERWHNGSIDLAIARDGTLYAAWTAYEGQLWLRSSRDGAAFDDAVVVYQDNAAPARAPALTAGADAVYLAWTVGETDSADVRIARSRDGKTFAEPVVVERTPSYSDAPKLAVDARSVLHVAWSESTDGPFDHAEIRYTRSRDGVTFEAPRTISQPHPRGVAGAAFPSVAIDGDNVVVTWEQYPPNSKQMPHGLAIAYSQDAGSTFSRPATIAGTHDRGPNGSHQGRLMRKLAARDGTLAVVNSALRFGEGSRVWLVRGKLPVAQDRSQRAKNVVTR